MGMIASLVTNLLTVNFAKVSGHEELR